MLTVTQLARKYRLSRTTILYYEREGLLPPQRRSENGYRWYGHVEEKKLESIIAYRSYGVSIKDIANLLGRVKGVKQEQILQKQFAALEKEIQTLRQQQKAIVMLLEQPGLLEQQTVSKTRWIEIMKAAGFDDEDMRNWHRQFEQMEPDAHQGFLESLNLDEDEINKIRSLKNN